MLGRFEGLSKRSSRSARGNEKKSWLLLWAALRRASSRGPLRCPICLPATAVTTQALSRGRGSRVGMGPRPLTLTKGAGRRRRPLLKCCGTDQTEPLARLTPASSRSSQMPEEAVLGERATPQQPTLLFGAAPSSRCMSRIAECSTCYGCGMMWRLVTMVPRWGRGWARCSPRGRWGWGPEGVRPSEGLGCSEAALSSALRSTTRAQRHAWRTRAEPPQLPLPLRRPRQHQ